MSQRYDINSSPIQNILIERRYQVNIKKYDLNHDLNEHCIGDLSNAGAAYALDAQGADASELTKILFPWHMKYFNADCNGDTEDNILGRLSDLSKACSFIVAEMELLSHIYKVKTNGKE